MNSKYFSLRKSKVFKDEEHNTIMLKQLISLFLLLAIILGAAYFITNSEGSITGLAVQTANQDATTFQNTGQPTAAQESTQEQPIKAGKTFDVAVRIVDPTQATEN